METCSVAVRKLTRGVVLGLFTLGVGLAEASTAELVKVRVAYSSTHQTGMPLFLSQVAPEIYAKHGISVQLVDTRTNAVNCVAAVLSGSADMCSTGTTAAFSAIAAGADLKLVAATQGLITEVYLSQRAAEKVGTSSDAPIRERLVALKGLNAVSSGPGTPHYLLFDDMLKTAGLSVGDIRFRTLVDPIAMQEGLRNNTFDIVIWGAGAFADIEKEGKAVRWISHPRGDLPSYAGLPFVSIFASSKWLKDNEGVAQAFHLAVAGAISALKRNPEQYSAPIKEKFYPDISDAIWSAYMKYGTSSLLDGALTGKDEWEFLRGLSASADPGKDYKVAEFARVVLPFAQKK